jgi:hypothetical protein
MSVRTPNTAPPGESGGSPTEPAYPWRLFVGMLIAIVLGGAVLAWVLGVNPLTFERLAAPAQPTAITTQPSVGGATLAVATVQPTIAPTPLILNLAAPTVAPTPATTPVAGSLPVAAATAVPVSTVQAQSAPATAAAPSGATAVPSVSALSGATSVPTVQEQPTPVQASVSPQLAAAILQGYDKYWSIRVRTSGNPNDTSLDLESVMAEDELQSAYKTLAQYREQGIAFRTTVEHKIWITRATPTDAAVVDRYSGASIKLSLATNEPESTEPVVESFTDTFFLKNVDGVWKVVRQQAWD